MASKLITPSVSFKLDDSEKIRLEKLRNRLKLHRWEKIQRKYTLCPDEDVANKIKALETTDPVKHEENTASGTIDTATLNCIGRKLEMSPPTSLKVISWLPEGYGFQTWE